MEKFHPIVRIISGGQTGADMGGLLAAEHLNLATGGTAPLGYRNSRGRDDTLRTRFGLKELTVPKDKHISLAQMYAQRSMENINNSDGTLAFRTHPSQGTDKSIGYCVHKSWKVPDIDEIHQGELISRHKPIFVVSDFDQDMKESFRIWVTTNNIKILNVVGHRDTNITQLVKNSIICLLSPSF